MGLRKLATNSARLLRGTALSALLNVIAVTLAAKSLDTASFGAYALLTGYATFVSNLADPITWQALIKFGSDVSRDIGKHAEYVRLSIFLDVAAMLLASAAILTIGPWAFDIFGISHEYLHVLWMLAVLTLFRAQGTLIGLLRLNDNFAALSWHRPIASVVLLFEFGALSVGRHPVEQYVLAFVVSEITAAVYIAAAAYRHFPHLSSTKWLSPRIGLSREELGAFGRFLLLTKGTATLNVLPISADILVVGSVLGEVGAGLYRVVRLFAQVPAIIQAPIYQAIYPQIAALIAKDDVRAVRRLAALTSLGVSSIYLLYLLAFMVLGKTIVTSFYGETYVALWSTAVVLLAGFVVAGLALPLSPIALSVGRPDILLRTSLVSVGLYFGLAVVLMKSLGLVGIGFANIIFYVVHACLLLFQVRSLVLKS
ncbi:hypothetical protein NKH74_16485 [Mesorhizobium sp. M0933]|uniref:lipopolysaccharide biosynthesis protein n=1 Tax=Mesorhizobium sp. M0933 TaxID=2957030 RepID=UPI003334CB20